MPSAGEQAMSSTFTASDAEGYERMMGRWSRLLASPFLDFARLATDGSVLDVGCGTGSLSRVAKSRPGRGKIVGVDLSEPFVEHAKKTVQDARFTFEVCDATELKFTDHAFDQAVSMLVLNFVPDCMKALREMKRVTRAGGTVCAAVWDFEGGLTMNRILWDAAAALDSKASEMRGKAWSAPLIRKGEMAQAFREVGLESVEENDILVWMRFTSFADWWEPFLAAHGMVSAYVSSLTAEAQAQLEAVVRGAYCAGRADGERSYSAVAHAVRGIVPG
jgi:SAM-dependent methyltransferase